MLLLLLLSVHILSFHLLHFIFLSLQVAFLFNIRFHGILPVYLLHSLLSHQAHHHGDNFNVTVLLLHPHHGFPLLPSHRHRRLLCLLLVCSQDLQRSQGGLRRKGTAEKDGQTKRWLRQGLSFYLDNFTERKNTL